MLSRTKMIRCACRTLRFLRTEVEINSTTARAFSDYRSKHSLDNLYPQSGQDRFDYSKLQKFANAPKPEDAEQEPFTGFIPLNKLEFSYCKSSGPGGQHVNKVNTKVEVRFNVDDAIWIPEWIKPKLKQQQDSRINKHGELIITSEKTRTQALNKADCLDKLRNMVFQATVVPKQMSEEEIAKINKRIEKAKKKAVQEKRHRSLVKQNRQPASF